MRLYVSGQVVRELGVSSSSSSSSMLLPCSARALENREEIVSIISEGVVLPLEVSVLYVCT